MFRSRIAVAALGALVLVPACAGGDDGPTSPTVTPPAVEEDGPSPPDAIGTSRPSPPPSEAAPPRVAAPVPEGWTFALETVTEGLPALTHAAAPPGDDRIFALTQRGRVLVLEPGGGREPRVLLDLVDRVVTGAERGLLQIAFHPTFDESGRFLVHYTEAPDGATRIVEYRLPRDAMELDPAAGRLVFGLEQPHRWHNGGDLAFGPAGHLWISLGDGGPGEDPAGRGQDPSNVYGAILRIDLDGSGGRHGDYGIPPDNPYADGGAGAPEVWAYGLRNPWQFDLDETGGHVYIGDVGQYRYEEIDVVPLDGGAGSNFGWAIREGQHCFGGEPCDAEGLVDPVVEYAHERGRCAVVGGLVYHGDALPELWGHYLYADACSGELFSFLYRDGEAVDHRTWADAVGTVSLPSAFDTDGAGEVLIATRDGTIHRLVPSR